MRPEQGLQMVVRDGSGGLGEALAFVYGSTVLEPGISILSKGYNTGFYARLDNAWGVPVHDDRKLFERYKQGHPRLTAALAAVFASKPLPLAWGT